jgi:hypothetical protein
LLQYDEDGSAKTYSLKGRDLLRYTDLVTQVDGEDRPQFIELKSYKGRSADKGNLTEIKDSVLKGRFSSWTMVSTSKSASEDEEDDIKYPAGGNHRQYLLDRIASTNNNLISNGTVQEATWKAQKIHWLFQDYKQKTVAGMTQRQIGIIVSQLAINAKGQPAKGIIEASLGIAENKKYNLKSSTTKAAKNVKLFNVKTILKDSGSSVVDTLFDMADLDAQQKAKLKTNIENLILKDAS